MYNKRFSKSLSDKYDPQGKRIAEEFMRDIFDAQLITENTAETDGDFKLGFWDQLFRLPDGTERKIEPEIKVNDKGYYAAHWASKTGVPFSWPTVDIPYRKHKCDSHAHIVASSDEDFLFYVEKAVMDAVVEEAGGPKFKRTKYEPDGGYYYAIPHERGQWYMKSGVWQPWRLNDDNARCGCSQ